MYHQSLFQILVKYQSYQLLLLLAFQICSVLCEYENGQLRYNLGFSYLSHLTRHFFAILQSEFYSVDL